MEQSQRVIRKPELFSKLSLSDATIWRLERAGKFPKRIQLGGNSVGWFANEIEDWLEQKSQDRTRRIKLSKSPTAEE